MEYKSERKLNDILPLLERLDRGEALTEEEQAELDAVRELNAWRFDGELPASMSRMRNLQSLDLWNTQVRDLTPPLHRHHSVGIIPFMFLDHIYCNATANYL